MLTSKYQRYEEYRRGNTNLGRVAPLSLLVVYFILSTKRQSWVHQTLMVRAQRQPLFFFFFLSVPTNVVILIRAWLHIYNF